MTQQASTITIAVDAMGGDHGPSVTVPAAIEFLKNTENLSEHRVILVGREAAIAQQVATSGGGSLVSTNKLLIHPASEVVEMDESPALALKKKKDSSMRVAINLVKEGQAQACVSAGNTGALMATARFVLKTIAGVDRPAIISTMPCRDPNTTAHMLDLGANVDSSPEMLVQFAIMGSVITQFVDGKKSPRVALLNVGAEEIKGSEKVKKASTLLADSDLNYVGYVEGDEMFSGKVDVIVSDGFEGNIALKSSEGAAGLIFAVLKEEFTRSWLSKFIALLSKPVLSRIQSRLDPRRQNGACLIGLNGVVIKSHGGTDALGYAHAIEEASRQAELDVIEHIRDEIERLAT